MSFETKEIDKRKVGQIESRKSKYIVTTISLCD